MLVTAGGSNSSRMPWAIVVAAHGVPLVVTLVAHLLDPAEAREARVAALVADVDRARAALLAHIGAVGSCGTEAVARQSVASNDAAWHAEACWATIGEPQTSLHALWVVGARDDFAVHGVADIDGDGESIEFVATRSSAAVRWTPPNVL